jgi:hypothetical protein
VKSVLQLPECRTSEFQRIQYLGELGAGFGRWNKICSETDDVNKGCSSTLKYRAHRPSKVRLVDAAGGVRTEPSVTVAALECGQRAASGLIFAYDRYSPDLQL